MYTTSFKRFRTTREKRSEDHRVRGQRAISQTEGCIVERKVKDTWIPACQRWPNTSSAPANIQTQWVTRPRSRQAVFHINTTFSFGYVYATKQTRLSACTHQADASYTGLGHRTLAHLRGLLPEEEIQLVVISLCAVGDEVYVDESGVCGEKRW